MASNASPQQQEQLSANEENAANVYARLSSMGSLGSSKNISMGDVVRSAGGAAVGSSLSQQAKNRAANMLAGGIYTIGALSSFFSDIDSNLAEISKKPLEIQRSEVISSFMDLKRRLDNMKSELNAK